MAAYLLAIERIDPEAALLAAEPLSPAPNCWSASQVWCCKHGLSAPVKRRIPGAHQAASGRGDGCFRTKRRQTSGRAA